MFVSAGQLYPNPTARQRGTVEVSTSELARGDQVEERVAEGRATRREEGESPHRSPRGERNLDQKVPQVQLLLPQMSVLVVLAHCRR